MQDDSVQRRRAFPLRLAAMGVWLALTLPPRVAAQVLGSMPQPLPRGKSIYRLRGAVRIDGVQATPETTLRGGEAVETGPGAEIVFAVGEDAFLLRQNSRVNLLTERAGLVTAFRIVTGALLSAFGRGPRRIELPAATIGIRGTGVYADVGADRTYLCTCYGNSRIEATGPSGESSSQDTHHHDAPKFIYPQPRNGRSIHAAPMLGHSDEELILIEALANRRPPFFTPDDAWGPARRR